MYNCILIVIHLNLSLFHYCEYPLKVVFFPDEKHLFLVLTLAGLEGGKNVNFIFSPDCLAEMASVKFIKITLGAGKHLLYAAW